ncbi:serine/threonine-protein kinase [Amycolatopsis echigonensis]|uniref:non-specific serine/threonine protein kinase n=1 Tax=Amycolatopsis echigonensis TaxID=2576905 RepID=A0A2N3WVD6_9PSEU|nr:MULTISPECIES: serine/threonine-protein kinase [Amycolatopsis]MBB2504790.1 protein kinase [Amycolatopsis echigonensis]PKV97827.1 serine/threonine protein kinase [Amycolatopsis niigatensis]
MHADQLIADRYRLLERVGSGGMGVVWRARDDRLDREVALKQARLSDVVSGRTLRREARLAAGVLHPNVVTFFDVAAEGDELWLVMEYVPSRSLAEILAAEGRLPAHTVAEIGVQIAAALGAVHEHGIVHRDVKPGNVLIASDGRAKLTDFGISRSVRTDETVTDSPLIGGTPDYLAPEVAQGHPPTAASDVFSLGATLFAAVEGSPPFSGGNEYATIRRVAEGAVPRARHADGLAPTLELLMRRDPAERPTAVSAGELLAEGIDALPVEVPRRRRNRRGLLIAGVAVAAVAIVGTAYFVTRPAKTTAAPPTAPVAQAKLGIGPDPRAADPCRLVDAAPLRPFGDPETVPDYGNFNRCDAVLRRGDLQADVKVELESPPVGGAAPEGAQSKSGPFTVFAAPPTDQCERLIQLQDRFLVHVTVSQDNGYQLNLCQAADTAVGSATKAMAAAGVPARATAFPAGSLAYADACSLLDAGTVASAAGVGAPVRTEPGFGGWRCDWNSPAASRSVTVLFDRDQPPDGTTGRLVRVGGHDAYLKTDGFAEGSCQAVLVYRTYTDAHGDPRVERLLVVVKGDGPPDRLCAPVSALAGSLAGKLPKT